MDSESCCQKSTQLGFWSHHARQEELAVLHQSARVLVKSSFFPINCQEQHHSFTPGRLCRRFATCSWHGCHQNEDHRRIIYSRASAKRLGSETDVKTHFLHQFVCWCFMPTHKQDYYHFSDCLKGRETKTTNYLVLLLRITAITGNRNWGTVQHDITLFCMETLYRSKASKHCYFIAKKSEEIMQKQTTLSVS